MAFKYLQPHFESSPYSQIAQEDPQKEPIDSTENGKINYYRYLLSCSVFINTILTAVAVLVGYFLGSLNNHAECHPAGLTDAASKVSIGNSVSVFQYNSTFAAPPPQGAQSEEVWDSMIPNGLGYIKDPAIATETSVLSVFHQLHCLYIVRRAYYSNSAIEGELEAFDLGKERKPHVAHCFDYLRQGILCSADSTVEPGVDNANGFLGAGFPRGCRDFGQLKDWAETHRAFDAHGFLVESKHG